MRPSRKKNAQYSPEIQAELDLHGHTAREAREAVEEFLWEAKTEGWTRVRIIVGKGTRSQDGIAVLPDTVKAFLTQHGYIYTYAKIQHGGEGALEVAL